MRPELVRARVVQDDELEVAVGLVEHAADGLGEELLAAVDRDAHGHARPRSHPAASLVTFRLAGGATVAGWPRGTPTPVPPLPVDRRAHRPGRDGRNAAEP